MSATVSTDFLLLCAQATPEQQAAIRRVLECGVVLADSHHAECGTADAGRCDVDGVSGALERIERKVDGLVAAAQLPGRKEPLQEAECLRVFRLVGELMAMGTELTASPARVFDLMVFRKLTKAEAAVACKCAASLITKRVAAIEKHFGMPIEKLVDFASDIKERQRTVKHDRYARKKHGAVGDEPEQDGDRTGAVAAVEDDEGYLPEERNE